MDLVSNNLTLDLDSKSSIKSNRSNKSNKSFKDIQSKAHTIVESEDISLSQLELMANKKKLTKKTSQDSISNIILKKASEDDNKSSHLSDKIKIPKKIASSSSSSNSSSTSSTTSTDAKKQKEKKVMKENKSDEIRKEKSELLYKFNKLNIKGKWSSLKLSMELETNMNVLKMKSKLNVL